MEKLENISIQDTLVNYLISGRDLSEKEKARIKKIIRKLDAQFQKELKNG